MKIICVGRNYATHAKELNNDIPKEPVLFLKPKTALLANEKPFYYPEFSDNIHFECELVLRICKNGKYIQRKFAHKYFDAVTVGLDFTARDLQDKQKEKGLPWEIAKAFDHSAVAGTMVPIGDMDLDQLNFSLKINDTERQTGNTADMIFPVDKIISYASQFFTLNIGDLIFTGTPAGVGPVQINDRLEGFLGEKKLLATTIL